MTQAHKTHDSPIAALRAAKVEVAEHTGLLFPLDFLLEGTRHEVDVDASLLRKFARGGVSEEAMLRALERCARNGW